MLTEEFLQGIEARPDWAMDVDVIMLCQEVRRLQKLLTGSEKLPEQSEVMSLEHALTLAGWVRKEDIFKDLEQCR